MNARLNIRQFFRNIDIIHNHKIEKAMKSRNPFVELDELFQKTIFYNLDDEYIKKKCIDILKKAYNLAESRNDNKNAYKFLYKLINFFPQHEKYPDLISYGIIFENEILIRSLMRELEYQYNQGNISLNLINEGLKRILAHHDRSYKYFSFIIPYMKMCFSRKELISILIKIADKAFQSKSFQEAKEIYLEILKYKHKSKTLYESLAHIYIKENKLNYACRYFEEALKLNTENLDLLLYFGSYYYNNRDFYSSKRIFLLYDALNPDYMKGKEILADIFIQENSYEDALFYINQLSEFYVHEGKTDKAYNIFKKLIEKNKANIEIRKSYINMLEYIGDYNEIKEQSLLIGIIHFKKKDLDKALDHFIILQDLANAQGDYFYSQKILDFIYQIQLRKKDYMNAIATIHSLLDISREINDEKSFEKYSRELTRLKIKRKSQSNSERSMQVSSIIGNLRDIANEILSDEEGKPEKKNIKTLELRKISEEYKDKVEKGIKLRRQGKFREAKISFINIIKEKKDITAVYPHLFHIFLREKDLLACKKVISAALKLSHLTLDEKALFLLMFGYIFLKMEDYERALKYYKMAYNLNTELKLMGKMDYIYRKNEEKKIEIKLNDIIDPLI